MSGALDELTADEKALFDTMRAEDNSGPAPEPKADQQRQPPETVETLEPVVKEPDAAKMVDKRALDEERTKRKAAERASRDREVELAKVNTRFEMLTKALEANAAQPAPAVAETPAPAFDTDPKAWIDHNVRELQRKQEALDRRLAELATGANQATEQQRQMQAVAELQAWGQAQEVQFAQSTPDYQAAIEHLRAAKEAELRAVGIEDPVQIAGMIRQAVINTADVARRNGRNFAEVLYATSKANGFTGNSPKTTSAPANAVDSAAERLIRGNDMATTLGSTGGAPRGEPAATAIANMSDGEFEALYAKIQKMPSGQSKAAMRNLFGT